MKAVRVGVCEGSGGGSVRRKWGWECVEDTSSV